MANTPRGLLRSSSLTIVLPHQKVRHESFTPSLRRRAARRRCRHRLRRSVKKKNPPMLYELRTYTTTDGGLPKLHQRFKDHTMKLFEKHGMKNVIYFTPADKPNTLIYLL